MGEKVKESLQGMMMIKIANSSKESVFATDSASFQTAAQSESESSKYLKTPKASNSSTSTCPFTIIPVTLPPIPLYKQSSSETYRTVSLEELIGRRYARRGSLEDVPLVYDGRSQRWRSFSIQRLPRYLILHYQGRGDGLNRTPISYPLTMDFSQFECSTESTNGHNPGLNFESIRLASNGRSKMNINADRSAKYRLLGNLCVGEDLSTAERHLDEREKEHAMGNYRLKGAYDCRYWTQLRDFQSGSWFEVKNTNVARIPAPSTLCLSTSVYLQVWERM
jgi:hypothetical protein